MVVPSALLLVEQMVDKMVVTMVDQTAGPLVGMTGYDLAVGKVFLLGDLMVGLWAG